MSSIAFTKQTNCNYDEVSTTNPALNGIVNIRQAIGLSDKSRWDKEWRPIFMNFIESSNMIAIDLTKEKAKSKQEFLSKTWEFINSVRDEAASNIPDRFLESAISSLINLLRAQVRSQVKEEPKEEGTRLTSFSSTTPAPRLTSVSASATEARVVPLTGRTTIILRRMNQSGYISSRYAYWSHLAVFPPSLPPTETLPEVATCEISVLHQLLEYHQIWNDKELIYWIDPNGNPFELAGDFDLRSMVFAAQNVQEPNRAREIVVKGSDTEPVLWRWSETSRPEISVRDPVEVKPSVTAKRPSQDLFSNEDQDDLLHKKSRRTGAPSTGSHATSMAIRSSARGRDEKPATAAAEHEQPPASKPKDGKGIATVEIDSNPDSESSDPAADAHLKGPSYDSADYTTAAANVIETEACAQMGENDVNWDAACELVKADKNRKGAEDDIKVQGLGMRMRKHQVIAAYWMLLTEASGCRGGMESDEMGYGKTVTCILRSYLNHCLMQATVDVKSFRSKGLVQGTVPHLPASTSQNPQAPNAQCPSSKHYPVQCPCQEWSVAAKLKPQCGANLAILPVSLIQTWMREFTKMFPESKSRFGMRLKIAWHGVDKGTRLRDYKLTEQDYDALLVDDKFRAMQSHSSWFILTSQHAATFKKLKRMKDWTWDGPADENDTDQESTEWTIKLPGICFSSIYIDEAHRLRRQQNPVMVFLRQINDWFRYTINEQYGPRSVPPLRKPYIPAKWFITGTPWERSPEDFKPALETIEEAHWAKPESPYHLLCQDSISQLAKEHEAFMKKALTGNTNGKSPEALKIINNIRDIVQLFMIRRTDDSYIHGHKVVKLPPITVEWAEFRTPSSLAEQIDTYRKRVSKEEREAYSAAFAKWKAANQNRDPARRDKPPPAPLDSSRKKAPSLRLRIFADFPGLVRFLFDEDSQPVVSAFTIEDLNERKDLFTRELSTILADSPKYQALLALLQGSWPMDPAKKRSRMNIKDKLVVISNFPMCAWLIAQGLSEAGFETRLIEGRMPVEERDRWQDFFQEDPEVLPELQAEHNDVTPPRILVATSQLCSLGLTLHKAHHLVKFDVDFLDGGDRQAIKRIYRIGQKQKSFVWRYITKDNTEECIVRRRQELRAGIVNEAFKLPTDDYEVEEEGDELDMAFAY